VTHNRLQQCHQLVFIFSSIKYQFGGWCILGFLSLAFSCAFCYSDFLTMFFFGRIFALWWQKKPSSNYTKAFTGILFPNITIFWGKKSHMSAYSDYELLVARTRQDTKKMLSL
jgi:hypothetical protein